MKKTWLFFLLSFAVFSFGSCQGNEDGSLKILFVGNSLTYTNDLPARVTAHANLKNITVNTDKLAYSNYALEDHWNDGELQRMIKQGKYDYVIVQQGPSSQADGRETLLTYGPLIAAQCKKVNTKLAFFMVWPAKVNLHTFTGVINNYRDAAASSNAILCPVGE